MKIFFKNKKYRLIAVGSLAVFLGGLVFSTLVLRKEAEAGWFNDDWQYRKKIVIDDAQVAGSSDLTDFPVLINLTTDNQLRDKAQTDGDDLLFANENGVKLDHEIEYFNATNGNLVAWVKVPTLYAAVDTVIYLYYGNATVTNQENPTGVWDADYKMVQHLKETSGAHLDSTSTNSNSTTVQVTTQGSATGKMNGADEFDNTDDYIAVGDSDNLDITGALTITAWIKADTFGTSTDEDRVVFKGGGSHNVNLFTFEVDDSNVRLTLHGFVPPDTGACTANQECVRGATTLTANGSTWYYVAGTFDGTTGLRVFVNGSQDGTNTLSASSTGTTNASTVNIGGRSDSASDIFDGIMDEVRISSTNRSADWISTEYNNQNSPGTFYSLNSEEKGPSPQIYFKFDEGQGQDLSDQTSHDNDGIRGASQSPGVDDPTWESEEFCISEKCLFYDGSDDVTTVGNGDSIDFNIGLFDGVTIQGWIRVNSDGEANTGAFFNKGASTYLRIENEAADGKADLTASLDLTTDATASITDGITIGKWHHVALAYTNDGDDEITIYIDGENRATSTNGVGDPGTDTANLLIGGDTTTNFHGFIDEFKIYNSERTAAEIKTDILKVSGLHGSAVSIGEKNYSFLSDGLAGYWKMDESTAWTQDCATFSVLDSSGNGNGGKSCPTTSGPDGIDNGRFANGGNFDGSDDYVDIDNPTVTQTTENFTVSFWMKNDVQVAGNTRPISHGNGSTTGWIFLLRGTGQAQPGQLFFQTDNNGSVSTSSRVDDSVWHHITLISDQRSLTLFLDGLQQDEDTFDSALDYSGTNLHVAASHVPNEYFDGTLDEIRMYNRALSPAEVSQLYNWAPGPVGYWKLDENTGTSSVSDSSGNGYNLTMNSIEAEDWTRGKFGSALTFDGNNEYLSCTDGNCGGLGKLDFGISPYLSWGGWFKTSTSGSMTIAGKKNSSVDNSAGYSLLQQAPSDLIRCRISDGTNSSTVDSSLTYNNGNWHHAVCITNGTTMSLYIDGVLINSGSVTSVTATLDNADNFRIGASGNTAQDWTGNIDDVKVYNYTRTATQIVEDMNAGHPAPGSPVGSALVHYKFDEGYGDTANNEGSGGSTYNGDLSGSSVCPQSFCPDWTNSGKFGKAIQIARSTFTADGDPFIRMTNDAFDTHTEGTVSIWFNVTEDGGNQFHKFFGMGENIGGVANTMNINYDQTNNRLRVAIVNDGSSALVLDTATNSITPGQWYHVAYSVNPSGNTFYVNGVPATVTYTTGSAATNLWFDDLNEDTTSYTIGCQDDVASDNDCSFNTQIFNGYLDDFRLYDAGLTADQIKIIYNQGQAQVFGATSTDSSNNPSFSSANEYCPPGQGSACTGPFWEIKMDEHSGTTFYDTSGNNRTAVWTDRNNGASVEEFRRGKKGSGYYQMADTADYSFITTSGIYTPPSLISMEAWVYPTATHGNATYDITRMDSGTGYQFSLEGSSSPLHLRFRAFWTTNGTWTVNSVVPMNQWTHVAVTYDSGSTANVPNLYVNGVLQTISSSTAPTGSWIGTADNLNIFTRINANVPFLGIIDNVVWYDYIRTPSQIAWSYNQGAPIGWWKFDECSGTTVYDTSGFGNNGTITPGGTGNTAAGSCNSGVSTEMWNNGTTGKRSASLDFDGTNDYVNIGDVSTYDFGTGQSFSIEAWVNRDTFSTLDTVFAKDNDVTSITDDGFSLSVRVQDDVQFDVGYGSGNIGNAISKAKIESTGWYHIVGVLNREDSTIKTYVNGKVEASSALASSQGPDNALDLRIGSESDGGEPFDGKIDNVRIYNYPLTAQQVKAVYNEGAVNFGD